MTTEPNTTEHDPTLPVAGCSCDICQKLQADAEAAARFEAARVESERARQSTDTPHHHAKESF
jgi:hypothetical protein